MESLWMDLRHSIRILLKNPGFTLAAVVCLMLGIGATTAIFSVVNAVLLRPLPYKNPGELIRVYTEFPTFPNGGLHRFWTSPPEFLDLRRDLHSWQSLDAWVNTGANLAGTTQPARVTVSLVSGGMLQMLGVSPARGRLITPQDDAPGATRVADISYGVWQSIYGSDPNILGRDTLLNGSKCTIIGVMPASFRFPPGEIDPPEVWTPLQLDPANPGGRGSHYLYLLGRLNPGVSRAQAEGELKAYVTAMGEAHPPGMHEHYFNPKNHTLVSYGLQDEVVSSVRPALLMLMAAVGFVLLIACVNVANLLLARAEARRREIAIRSALGAGTWRLAAQFIREGLLLSGIGAVFGLALAYGGLRLIQLTNAGSLPRASEISIDGRVLLFAVAATLLTGVLFGLAPIIPLAYQNLQDSLKDTVGSTTSTASAQGFRRVLVAGELAMALVLLIGCGLMVRGFWKLQEVHTGMDPDRVITMNINLPRASYPKPELIDAFWTRMDDAITHLPGIDSAAIVSGLPPVRPPNMNDTKIENFVRVKDGPIENVDYYQVVSKDYFKTMGIRLMEGRLFDDRDGKGAPDVVIINQTMARTFWKNESPIGKRIQPGYDPPWCTIIGVVEDVKNAGLDKPAGTELYVPYTQTQGSGNPNAYLVLRGRGDPRPFVAEVRQKLDAIDPTIPLAKVATMDSVMSEAESQPRFLTLLLTLFSGVALIIATVGIYGVISYSVARRSKEFGLRMALGAQPGNVLALVMKQGAILTAIGVAVGIGAALGLTQMMSTLLFGVRPTDPLTFLSVSAILAAVALAASYIPALRATKVDPMKALRYE
ncbi:MAG TPA: ABC transporter permease [Candidatus Limnocylindrales bacterium]|nr:ABC transporter permease [Candidatus Limnocylindrales bacterium]